MTFVALRKMPQNRISETSTGKKIDGLNTLRAAAIVLVFMFHYSVFVSHAPTFGWGSTIGWVGVDLFFVLSGYLIANQIFAGIVRGERLSLRAFYARRFLRTLPNYYVVLALFCLFPTVMGGGPLPPLWKFLTFTQNYLLKPGTGFSHAWSLCVEEQFYLLLPAAALLGVRYGKSIRLAWLLLVALLVAGIAYRSAMWLRYGLDADDGTSGYYPHIYYSSFCRADEFLPGVAVAMLKNFHRSAWERVMRWGHVTLAAGVLSVGVMFYLLLHYYEIDDYGYGFFMTGFGYSLLAISFAVLMVAALSPGSILHRARIPGAARLAAWSYAIYLSHKPLAVIMQQLLAHRGIDAGSGVGVLIITFVCLLGGWALYTLIETPFMNLRDRYYPTNFPPAAPLSER
jgi:peptidoglycan/LPS O-acetylase OafA/YrhL